MEAWWIGIAIAFIVVLGLFLLGIYLLVRKFGNKFSDTASDVAKIAAKETFKIIKDKIKKD